MIDLSTLTQIIQSHGLVLLFPVAVLEGPILTVIAAWLARQGLMNIAAVYGVCVLADLVGDGLFYALGRHGLPPAWQRRFGLTPARRRVLKARFRDHGPRIVVIGKLTHTAGLAVLLGAGASRMPFGRFLLWNLLASLPKTLVFLLIGYVFGGAASRVEGWIAKASLVGLALALSGLLIWAIRRRIAARGET
ncbi:DedA family protein [Paracoccus jiaweipingae]|uniref:DedA family protein n=1 Tax=unclassified Paracoccus (in: a-proteobacteria) TaxID=2688777 RepID=UPI0037AB3753